MSDDLFSPDFNLHVAELNQNQLLQDNEDLRLAGFPQVLLDVLRSSGMTTRDIFALPQPRCDRSGQLLDEWWLEAMSNGVPESAVPPRHRQSTDGMSRTDRDMHHYSSLHTNFRPRALAAPPGTPDPTRVLSFGSPVRPNPGTTGLGAGSGSLPPPGTPVGSSGGGAVGAGFSGPRTPGSSGLLATPFGSQIPPSAPGVDYLHTIPYAVPMAAWPHHRDALLRTGVCKVFHAFAISDKQFQTLISTVRIPYGFKDVGKSSFTPEVWRDVRESFEALDVWNLFCAVLCGNFRVVLDGNDSMSLGGNEVAQVLQDAPATHLLGHSELTASLSRWHAAHVLNGKTLVWASLASVVLRDRILRPAILAVISAEAKTYLRATYPRDNAIFPSYVATLHSWRFKEEDVWSALSALELKLASKKPRNKPIRDWRADLDMWRSQRLALANADIHHQQRPAACRHLRSVLQHLLWRRPTHRLSPTRIGH